LVREQERTQQKVIPNRLSFDLEPVVTVRRSPIDKPKKLCNVGKLRDVNHRIPFWIMNPDVHLSVRAYNENLFPH
jgi:hypothetical protein